MKYSLSLREILRALPSGFPLPLAIFHRISLLLSQYRYSQPAFVVEVNWSYAAKFEGIKCHYFKKNVARSILKILQTTHFLQLLHVCSTTLTHGCFKVHGGVPIVLCLFVDALWPRINGLVFRECLIALFMISESWSSSHDSWFKCQQKKKQYNTRETHFTEIVY